jgi:signal peptidase I
VLLVALVLCLRRVGYRISPNEVTSRSMVDSLRRKDFVYGAVVTPFDEAL